MICIYEADCTDFANNGLCVLQPQSCTVTETLNGEYELTLVHPLDEGMRWAQIVEGRILRAPVPAAMTPQVKLMEASSGSDTLIYRIGTPSGKRLYLRSGPGTGYKSLGLYSNGSEVVLLSSANGSWYEVTTPDGKRGYMYADYLTYVRTESSPAIATGEVVEPTQMRDQPFRIYRVVPDLTKVTVYARHIFYDLMENMIQKCAPSSTATGAAVIQEISQKCLSGHDFTFYSDLESKAEEFVVENTNPVEAILGDEGLVDNYGGELVRDWFDVYVVQRVGGDTDVTIREGKNLTGVSYDVDVSDVTTRIMPTGEDKDGNVLYLPEVYVDSELIGEYPAPKWGHLEVSEAKEVTSGDDKKTKTQCYEEMRQAAKTEFENGCDLPTITLTVDFVACENTAEYAQYASLQYIYLGDAVHVIAPRIGLSVFMRMTQYTYDCLTRKYTGVTLGTATETIESSMISARQLAAGTISGTKLAVNSIGASRLQALSVGSAQLKLAAIGTAHIQNAAITNALIANAAITYAKIEEAAIEELNASAITATKANISEIISGKVTADSLVAGAVTAEKIEAGSITSESIAAGAVTAEKIASKTITAEQLKAELITADSGLIAVGAIQTAQIADGSITTAKIVELSADVIKSGTLQTERLLLVGEGGVVYEINAASSGLSETELTDEKYQSYINGTVIVANSITAAQIAAGTITANEIAANAITAAQINVSDLFASEATIQAINAMDITGNTYLKLMVTSAVDDVQVGGRNYALGTGDAYTAESDGGARRWLYPWPCADEATAKGLYGQTVTVSFDYDSDIASGSLGLKFHHTWAQVFAFGEGQASGERFEGVFELAIPETYAENNPETVLYLEGTWDGSVTIRNLKLELGNRATDWTPAPEDPAGGVKTSCIEIADDHITVSSGGNVNIDAGSAFSVNSGSFDVVTGDFQLSLAGDDGANVVMDIDDDGHTTFKAIHAGNVREAVYGYAYFTTETMGSLSALAEYLKRTDARIVEYVMTADEYGSSVVSFGYFNGFVKITAGGHIMPPIKVDYAFSGTLWVQNGTLSALSSTGWCVETHNGKTLLDNCWFTGEVTYGVYVGNTAEVRWMNTVSKASSGAQGYTLNPFLWTRYGGTAFYYGYIPGGGIWPDSGWITASSTVFTTSGDGGSASETTTVSLTGTLGYYGSANGWHSSECFQGYTSVKGRAYACLSFDVSGVGATVKSAKLTLHRKSGAGLNRAVNLTVYGTTAARGSSPISSLTSAYASASGAIGWDSSATLDVTEAAQALKDGSIAQLVLYTGETSVYSGKVYSYHYAQFDSATLTVTYTG